MHANEADYTLTFYHLSQLAGEVTENDEYCRTYFRNPSQLDEWLVKWRARLKQEEQDDAQRQATMQTVNPVYIPRNHQIEAAIRAAEDNNDLSVFHELHEVLQSPFKEQSGKERYQLPPKPEEIVHQTFCGT